MKWIKLLILLVVLVTTGWWTWQRVFVTEEQRVARLIQTMERAVEQGNMIRLADAIAADYSDDHGLDRATLIGAIRNQCLQYDLIFIHLSDPTITVAPDRQQAEATLIAKVLVRPRGGAEPSELFTDRFRLCFRKADQGWKLTGTETPELKFD